MVAAQTPAINSEVYEPTSYSLPNKCSRNPATIRSPSPLRVKHSPAGHATLEAPATDSNEASVDHMKKKLCRIWNSTGACKRGNRCPYEHNIHVQGAISLRDAIDSREEVEERRLSQLLEAEAARRARTIEEEAARQARLAQEEAEQKVHQMQQEARRLEISKDEAAMTFQQVIRDFTVVTFGAGVVIQDILTGFESCRVRVKNLPSNAKYNEVSALFMQQGMTTGEFHVVWMKPTPTGKQEAEVICQKDLKVIAIGLDGIDFRQEQLVFEVHQNASAEGMKASTGSNSHVLTISWRAPSASFVVTYPDISQAERKVKELDRKLCAGRKVKVEMNKPPAGQHLRHFTANAVTIRGFPSGITDAEVEQFSGSTLLRRLKSTLYDDLQAPEYLRRQVKAVAQGWLQLFENVVTDATEGICTVRAHFESWEQAKRVYNSLDKQRFWFIGNSSLMLRLPDPLHYTITIGIQQYHAQKTMWGSLLKGTKNKDGCNMSVQPRDWVCVIRVVGEDKGAVGSLKVRVENLAAGVKLEHWHRSLGTGSQQFMDSIFETTGAYVRTDWRNRLLRAYGEPRSVDAARAMLKSEVERLESLEQTVFLKRQSVGFFVRRGLAILEEDLGKENVALDISSSPCKITIKGGEVARHTLSRLIEESLDHLYDEGDAKHGSNCPICYDEISSPMQLGCGHSYCTACILHFFTSASDTKIFPLSCMGDENKCHIPIPIPVLQRFLLPQQFKLLLETAFFAHIEHFPQEFRYCTTPDCSQVYRCNRSSISSILHCPSCLAAVCSSCNEEAHEGMTCADRKIQVDPAEQERLNDELATESGFKKCPECKVWIEKTEGCNHMSCKCGAHICWVCMGVFTRETIYPHMHMAHGGIHDVDAGNHARVQMEPYGEVDIAAEEYVVQVEVLRQAALRRERQPDLLRWDEQFGVQRLRVPELPAEPFQQRREATVRRQEEARRQENEEAVRRRAALRQEEARRHEEFYRQAEFRRQEALRQADARWREEVRRREAVRKERQTQQDNGRCIVM